MNSYLTKLEDERLRLQSDLDSAKTQGERNRLGQFATPTSLAQDVLTYSATLLPERESLRFLDPALGTGAFYSALLRTIPQSRIVEALGFEVDAHYGGAASRLWAGTGLETRIADFTRQMPVPRYNLVICNPPYVRHHHLANDDKARLQAVTRQTSEMRLSGLAGLYCHFLGISHGWMEENGVAGWLIPSEFMDVNYGQAVKRYLLNKVTLIRIHRFDPNEVQFSDALVSSAIVWFRKTLPPKEHSVSFTFGGTPLKPALNRVVSIRDLANEPKWTRFPASNVRDRDSSIPTLSDLFWIRRGLATGDNSFFVLDEQTVKTRHLPFEALKPILPSPRYLAEDVVTADADANPLTARRLFLIDTQLSEEEIKHRLPALYVYLQEGRERGLHERYLCRHRTPWYRQESRPPAPIVCTYLGRNGTKRGRPFRFILNHSRATVTNVYLAMYPKRQLANAMTSDPHLIHRIWQALNSIPSEHLLGAGRVYGGGLHKLEPRELANVDATAITEMIANYHQSASLEQMDMFAGTRLERSLMSGTG